jgi:hypothetical protein
MPNQNTPSNTVTSTTQRSWCDKLASLPSVGLKFSNSFTSSAILLDKITPFLDSMATGDTNNFTLLRNEPFSIAIDTEQGFQYTIEPGRVFITKVRKIKIKNMGTSHSPIFELPYDEQSYTQALQELVNRIVDFSQLLIDFGTRRLIRVGIVTTTSAKEDEFPPGIIGIINELKTTWNNTIISIDNNIKTVISRSDDEEIYCAHRIVVPEESPDSLVTIIMDWQKQFIVPKICSISSTRKIIDGCVISAINYFELFASGDAHANDINTTD